MYVFENFLNIHSVDLWNRYITDSIAKDLQQAVTKHWEKQLKSTIVYLYLEEN